MDFTIKSGKGQGRIPAFPQHPRFVLQSAHNHPGTSAHDAVQLGGGRTARRQLKKLFEGDGFFDGAYKGKALLIDSSQSGEEKEENVVICGMFRLRNICWKMIPRPPGQRGRGHLRPRPERFARHK
ncbi:MAG: hypothetical protein LBR23_04910 [Spirochaetaceae bacterium]|jgi:hypothetical protein|nr:hypothetical protein [Spirochaetaceae bacterium]